MKTSGNWKQIETLPPPYVVESAFGRFVHREFPVQIARIRQAKK